MFKNTKVFSSFSAADMAKTKDFYSKKLGIKVTEESEGLMLHIAGNNPILVYPASGSKAAKYTILNFPVDDVEKAVDELAKRGVKMEQYDMPMFKTDAKGIVRNDGSDPGPKAMAWFKDPDGHVLSLMQLK